MELQDHQGSLLFLEGVCVSEGEGVAELLCSVEMDVRCVHKDQ